jgi:hypothetical protein
MGGVADFVGDVVSGVGDLVEGAGDLVGDAVEFVGDSVADTVEGVVNTAEAFIEDPIEFTEAVINNALENPVETAAIVAAAYFAPELVMELAPELSAEVASVATKALTGASKAAITGGDILEGLTTGAISGTLNVGMNELKSMDFSDLTDAVSETFDMPEELSGIETIETPTYEDVGVGSLPVDDMPEELSIPEYEEGVAALPINTEVEYFEEPELLSDPDIETIPEPVIGDQPGDFPTTPEEFKIAEAELEKIPFETYGDQPGDFPTTPADLALEDQLMGQIGDQPGDFPTEGSYGDPMAPGVKEAVKDLLDYNADYATGDSSINFKKSGESTASKSGLSPTQLAALAGIGALATKGINMPDVPMLGYQGPPVQYTAERIPSRGVKYTPVQAAQGGLMNLMDPYNAVQMYQAGGKTEADAALEGMMKAGAGQSVGIANQLNYLMGRGLSADQAKKILQQGVNVYSFARGGISDLGSYTHATGGRMLKGPGDGMSDSIPASIEGKRPAKLATDEFVVPADVVSHLGNGSSDAGAKVLYEMMDKVRKARTGTKKQGKQINPGKYLPK